MDIDIINNNIRNIFTTGATSLKLNQLLNNIRGERFFY